MKMCGMTKISEDFSSTNKIMVMRKIWNEEWCCCSWESKEVKCGSKFENSMLTLGQTWRWFCSVVCMKDHALWKPSAQSVTSDKGSTDINASFVWKYYIIIILLIVSLLRPVMYIKKLNSSITPEVFQNFLLLVDILRFFF